MGMDLISESGDDLRLNNFAWATVLELAQRYGWEPRGTLPPEDWMEVGGEAGESWDWDDYGSNEGQLVTAEDAAGIAQALESALSDPGAAAALAEMGAEERRQIEQMLPPEVAASFAGMPSFEEYRPTIEQFAVFCRKGGFRIE